MARDGKGGHFFVKDRNQNEIKTKIVDALRKASEPCYQECEL